MDERGDEFLPFGVSAVTVRISVTTMSGQLHLELRNSRLQNHHLVVHSPAGSQLLILGIPETVSVMSCSTQ